MKQVTPISNNIIVKVIETESVTKGGIVLPGTALEASVHGVVIARGEYAYHRNGTQKSHEVEVGDTVCFMKNSGTTVMEAPDGETWLAVPEDCIYYKVK